MNNNELLYKVYSTTISMLKKRGYNVPNLIKKEEFNYTNRDNLIVTAELNKDIYIKYKELPENSKIIVFFPDDEKIGVRHIRQYYDRMIELEIFRAILVVRESITSFAKNEILSFANSDNPVNMEVFLDTYLMFDITEHELVPKHELLTDDEKNEVLVKHGIKPLQLPVLRAQDPISRFYDFKPNSVVKITRLSETGGYSINYRVVV